MRYFILLLFSITYLSIFGQEKNIVLKEMVKYTVEDNLKSKLQEITNRLKPEDQNLIFSINISPKGDGYFIAVSTSYDIDTTNRYKGFFYINNKLFVILKQAPPLFLQRNKTEKIAINSMKKKASNTLVEPYIDELPIWFMQYEKNTFNSIYFSY